ncbi:MAG TPA: ABC transporter ATP-binding protein [Acidimicrobiales bacterium]|nr:ABC transporter ATP-binding protein [Acidimicrobiales bacterium]
MTQTEQTAASGPAIAGVGVLEVRKIGVSFSGVVALHDVSLDVARGEVLGLIGPNGAGKTTLFDVVSGLRDPQRGSIVFDGNDVTNRSAVWRSRAGMRRTFQRQQVFGRLTVEENLLCALEWKGGGGGILADLVALPTRRRIERRRRAEVDEYLERCGLGSVRHTMAGSLPIGTARMVELGRALAQSPSLLLLDEPTSGLGEAEVECLRAVVDQLRSDGSCAVLLVEHDISFVMSHCDRIVVLQRGEVLAEGTPDTIQANREVRDAYLG